MAQHEGAAEGAVTPDSAPADAIEALADEWLKEEDEQAPEDGAEPEGEAEAELTEDDVEEEEAEDPPIDPPTSWTAEEKEAFKALPRNIQETVNRRESERERFVQTKASEASRAKASAESEAMARVAEIDRQAAAQLQALSASLLPQKPDPSLLRGNDADRAYYYEQQAVYDNALAQQQQVQREAEARGQRAQQIEQELQVRERQEMIQTLQDHFPEYLDPSAGAKHQQELASIAAEMGYPPELITQARAVDILAVRKASEWKGKAQKYDALMAKKMERVRAAKGLPRVTRPGAASTTAQTTAARRQTAWDTVKKTRDPNAFADYLEATGVKL